jgi:tetratricopeptide (TPR) repeat protein
VLLFALLAQAAQPVPTPPPPPLHGGPQEMTCPVGGERFSAWQATSYTTMGMRPDGRPYSYLPFPLPIPECPTNKLILFDKFADAEVAKLDAVLKSEQYLALIDQETPYYRGYWLAAKLGRNDDMVLSLLLKAIWEATPGSMGPRDTIENRERSERYQREFASQVEARSKAMAPDDKLGSEALAANAYRQLGEFKAAAKMRERAYVTLQSANADAREGWERYLKMLGAVIERHDASVEPLDMIPESRRVFACVERQSLSAFDRRICKAPDVAEAVKRFRARTGRTK